MSKDTGALTPAGVRRYYDWLGSKLDTQGFYEDPALDRLVANGEFAQARRVFELGCGTGRLAERLLSGPLPSEARYEAVDVSPVMVRIARERLAPFGERARVELSDGSLDLPPADGSVDRVVATFVLDLLSERAQAQFFSESHRILAPGGLLCLASLTPGVDLPSKAITFVWRRLYGLHPALVGGCHPIRLEAQADPAAWRRRFRQVVTPFGVPSEVLVLEARSRGPEQ